MKEQFELEVPVVFCTFNRLECTKKVFEQIKIAKPKKLYLVSDGARDNVPGEAEKVERVRNYLSEQIDWECEVFKNFAEKNLGCGKRMSSGISWAFKNEESLIILEDDCLVRQSFFRFCQEMLELYRDDERIGVISGYKSLESDNIEESYSFSGFTEIWGWATWKRVWDKYDYDISAWRKNKITPYMKTIMNKKAIANYKKSFESVYKHKLDTWDYQFQYQLMENKILTVIPNRSMVENVGFDNDATHTKEKPTDIIVDQSYEMEFPLKHPTQVVRDISYDKKYVEVQWPSDQIGPIKRMLGMKREKSI